MPQFGCHCGAAKEELIYNGTVPALDGRDELWPTWTCPKCGDELV